MRLRPWLCFGLLFALPALPACFEEDDYDESRMRGDLGRGTFVYGCLNDSDTSCDDGVDVLPAALAVGGRFDVRFSRSAGGALPSVISPATDLVRRVDGAFEVQSAGQFALLAVNANSEVIDLKHLVAAEVEEVRVQQGRELPATTFTLAPKQSVQLLAVPFAQRGIRLGGALDYAWSSSDERLLSVESLPGLNRVRVRAGSGAGQVLLRVEVAGSTHEVHVQIGDAERDAGSDAGLDDGGTDAALDAGPEQDAGTDEDAEPEDDAASADASSDAAIEDAAPDSDAANSGGDA